MSFEESNDYSIFEMMKYLIQKLESRYNSILNFNKLVDSYNSPQDFFTLKNEFKQMFNDLENDFRQGIFAIKALSNQNKNILDNVKIKNNEYKNIMEKLNSISSENKDLKLQILKLKEKSSNNLKKDDSKKKITINNIKEKKENNSQDKVFNNNNNKKNSNISSDKTEMKKENIPSKKNSNYELEQLSNVKNIMNNIKKNKMKLKMAIEQHFVNKKDN